MAELLTSASKIVFILLAFALVGLTAFGIVEAKDFIMLTSMAFTFYFANKGTEETKYLGK